ncbi:hypothetical protein GCM10027081_60800 [Cupriavidus yeoncheonensis]
MQRGNGPNYRRTSRAFRRGKHVAVLHGAARPPSLDLLCQFWPHTTRIPKPGWFGYVFNTPSAHRVHHASNVDYLDAGCKQNGQRELPVFVLGLRHAPRLAARKRYCAAFLPSASLAE